MFTLSHCRDGHEKKALYMLLGAFAVCCAVIGGGVAMMLAKRQKSTESENVKTAA